VTQLRIPSTMKVGSPPSDQRQDHTHGIAWGAWPWVGLVVVSMLLLDVVDLVWLGLIVPGAALVLVVLQRHRPPSGVRWVGGAIDRQDLFVVSALYLAVVGLFRLAFDGFGTDRVAGLFLTFAAGLLLGTAGPVIYTVWDRGRTLHDLGIGGHQLRPTAALALGLAGVQFTMTLWGYDLPRPVDWVPLLVMSLVVGAFEAVFFRGFVQTRLEAGFGTAAGLGGAALLYALYHVGYGMGTNEVVFLFGLGLIYAISYRLTRNLLVLWPLLTPVGAFLNNLESGDIELPWASIAGFADVAVVMAVVILLARRHERKRHSRQLNVGTERPQIAA